MIRDPSDGSVREKSEVVQSTTEPTASGLRSLDVELAALGSISIENYNETNDLISTSTSGLPLASTKPENIAKLERSREWLENYLHRKES